MQNIRYSRYLKSFVIFMDLAAVAGSFLFCLSREENLSDSELELNLFTLALLLVVWLLLSARTALYNIPRTTTYTTLLEKTVSHLILFLFCILLIGKATLNEVISGYKFELSLLLFPSIILVKTAVFLMLKYIRKKGLNHRNVMFLSDNQSTCILRNVIAERPDYGLQVYDYHGDPSDGTELKKFWRSNGIHSLFVPIDYNLPDRADDRIFRLAEQEGVKMIFVPSVGSMDFNAFSLSYFDTQPILQPAKYPLDYFANLTLKRSLDILFSTVFLVVIGSWLFPLVVLLIRMDSKGPAFFVQKRYGYRNEVFGCLKFRTMVVNKESNSATTRHNDSRITRIGRFLRKTNIDEMPQFINVFLGDMSVVGPRPHMLAVDDRYKPGISRYNMRSRVRPGITGLAQVKGFRGDTGNMKLEMKKRILADIYYVKNWSLSLDLVIIFKTVYTTLVGLKK